jgi:hypothetical protein
MGNQGQLQIQKSSIIQISKTLCVSLFKTIKIKKTQRISV